MIETTERHRELCLICNRSQATCFCKYTKPFDTRTRFVILMHPREYKRQRTGTGRVTRLSLINSEILVGVDFTQNARLLEILQSDVYLPMLLFPGAGALEAGTQAFRELLGNKIPLVLILDATWSSARKMLRSSPNLAALPSISFSATGTSRFAIKRQPRDFCLSTIEAAYHTLEALDASGFESLQNRHSALLHTLDQIVDFQLGCEANPGLPSHRKNNRYFSAKTTP